MFNPFNHIKYSIIIYKTSINIILNTYSENIFHMGDVINYLRDDRPSTRLTERRNGILQTDSYKKVSQPSKIYCFECKTVAGLNNCNRCNKFFCLECYLENKNICTTCNKTIKHLNRQNYIPIKLGSCNCFSYIRRALCSYRHN